MKAKRLIAFLLFIVMTFSLGACGNNKQTQIDFSGKLDKLPTKQESYESQSTPVISEPESQTQTTGNDSSQTEKPAKPEVIDPAPIPALDTYENQQDHPLDGFDLTAFDGVYYAETAPEGNDETWLQIKGYNDFILLEYHGLQSGEIYRYWVEEFWPGEGWYTSTKTDIVLGKSQVFSSMAQYENYSELPQNRIITLTEDGVILSSDDSDDEYFIRDNSISSLHTTPEELREHFGESVHLDFDYQYDSRDVLGTWGYGTNWDNACVTFEEDGTFSLYYKKPNKPIAVYEGVYGFGEYSGNLEIMAERIGYGAYPFYANWEWSLEDSGELNIIDSDSILLADSFNFQPVEEAFFTVMDSAKSLGYVFESINDSGDYTDSDGIDYQYYFSLPQIYSSQSRDIQRVNNEISDIYYSIIESEFEAMNEGYYLTYDYVDWQSAVYNGVLFIHVYAFANDWEEHNAYYIDTETQKRLTGKEVLERLDMDEDYFLDTVREAAEETFVHEFSGIPAEHREEYGYYDCLEQTISDEFVNLDLPIFVDGNGNLCVYAKISVMAGSGLMWTPIWFYNEGGVYESSGAYVEEAVG